MFDLNAYLERIGTSAVGAADAETLVALQRAHRMSIPFENFDVRLGGSVEIGGEAVFERLVADRRGGYCFQQNQLFIDALVALGFDARPLLARVWLGATETPPLTHSLLLVEFDGTPWIADAGFGGSFAPAMPLVDGARTPEEGGAHFRLNRRRDDWMLDRVVSAGGDGPTTAPTVQPQYSFDLRQVFPADLELANHWTATAEESIFRKQQFINIVLPGGFVSLVDREYTEHHGGGKRVVTIDSAASLRRMLRDTFGLDLSQNEVEALNLF